MSSHGVSLLSGGMDSAAVTAGARGRVDSLTALTFRYGQTHAREVDAAREIAADLGIAHRIVDISFLGEVAWYSALTSPDRFPVPAGRTGAGIGFGVPITYVPLRNTIFLALGAALAESEALSAIETGGDHPAETDAVVFLAPNAIDYSGYPDCRPEFFRPGDRDDQPRLQARHRARGAHPRRDPDHRHDQGRDRAAGRRPRGEAGGDLVVLPGRGGAVR